VNQLQQSTNRLDDQYPGFTAGKQRILVVEDDPDISHLLEIHLRDNAYKVGVVGNGIAGFERAGKHSYQLIVLDLMLPGIDGLEVCLRTQCFYRQPGS
jgi:DNA-binding response OmpR family regulator